MRTSFNYSPIQGSLTLAGALGLALVGCAAEVVNPDGEGGASDKLFMDNAQWVDPPTSAEVDEPVRLQIEPVGVELTHVEYYGGRYLLEVDGKSEFGPDDEFAIDYAFTSPGDRRIVAVGYGPTLNGTISKVAHAELDLPVGGAPAPTPTPSPSTGSGGINSSELPGGCAHPLPGSVYTDHMGYSSWRGRCHDGLDMSGATGVHAIFSGRARFIPVGTPGYNCYGSLIEITSSNGRWKARYAHVTGPIAAVREGRNVTAGERIGFTAPEGSAEIGCSTGRHLHLELRYDNKLVDPGRFMRVVGIDSRALTNPGSSCVQAGIPSAIPQCRP